MRGKQKKRRHTIRRLILLVLVLTVGFSAYYGVRSFAADEIYLEIDGQRVNPTTPISMVNQQLQLNMKTTGVAYDDTSLYEVDWSIEDQDPANPIATIRSGSTQTIGLVSAVAPGEVTVTVTVKDKMNGMATLATTTCKIRVVFSIDTTGDDSIYKKVFDADSDKSLVLYADHDPIQLGLNFGDASNTQWTSNNTEIISVGQRTGVATPVGAGQTTITATYTAPGSTRTETAELKVYVIPRVADNSTDYHNGNFKKAIPNAGRDKGDYLYLDSFFGDNNTQPIGDKVSWVIKQDSGANRVVIANSLPMGEGGVRSDLISLDPISSQSSSLEINAKAGVYYIEFYTAGTYKSEANKTTCYSPTTVKLTVFANFENYEEILTVGDKYDMAAAFNLTLADFNSLFNQPVLTYGGGSASNYATYDATTANIKAIKSTSGAVDVSITGKNSDKINAIMNPSSPLYGRSAFTAKLTIVDGFSLDRTSTIISVGQSLQINPIFTGSVNGHVKWESNNPTYVTVSDTGMIQGIKETKNIPDVTITASLTDDDGRIVKSATCSVKVETTISGFTITPDNLQMKIGDNETIKANIRQAVSTANLNWIVEDSSVVSVETAADNKSAVITAKKGGTTKLIVTNPNNGETHWCTITVMIPIQSMNFSEPIITSQQYLQTKIVRINYTPATANATDMTFTSSDNTVASIEKKSEGAGYIDCLVTMKKPGTVILTATPNYNPYTVMAMCQFTVTANCTGMTLDPSELEVNVGAENAKRINAVLEPVGSSTTVTWTSSDTNIATVDATGLVIGKKAGLVYITAQTSEGILRQAKVMVKQPCNTVSFNPSSYTMKTGDTYKPVMVLNPTDTTDTFTWSSFDTKIATVDANGVITAKASGDTFITATSTSGKMGILRIYVQDPVAEVTIDTKSKTIKKGQSFTITPTFRPATAYNKNITWTSDDPSIAKVEVGENGYSAVVTGVKGGKTVIIGVTEDGGKVVHCIVTVTETVTSVTVSPKSYYLKLGNTFTVKASVKTDSATNKGVTWSTGNKSIATVTSGGKVKGKKVGTTTITAKAKDGSGKTASCTVRVVRKVTSVRLNKYTARVFVGKTITLKKYISPSNATVKTCTWSSSNSSIASVSGGRVYGIAPGMVRIKCTATDGSGKSATCLVSVVEPVAATGVSAAKPELIVAKGRKIPSGLSISPANSTDSMKYYSDDKYVATVDKHGKIYCKRTGQVTIYGITSNGKEGYVDVLVVGMNRTTLKMRQYDSETLSVNEISKGVTWYSSNPQVASVVAGKVIGRKPGRTTIYATVRGVKVSCRVTITKLK